MVELPVGPPPEARGLHVGQLMEVYGGGGHRNAAGCWVPGPRASAEHTFVSELSQLLAASPPSDERTAW